MTYFLTIGDHLLPTIITIVVTLSLIFITKGLPYLRYVRLVANAKDEESINNLAKYLAKHTGGKHIDVDPAWRSFIPAATEIHELYLHKALNVYFPKKPK